MRFARGNKALVKMIDFAHAHPIPEDEKEALDESYITGLRQLIQIFESMEVG